MVDGSSVVFSVFSVLRHKHQLCTESLSQPLQHWVSLKIATCRYRRDGHLFLWHRSGAVANAISAVSALTLVWWGFFSGAKMSVLVRRGLALLATAPDVSFSAFSHLAQIELRVTFFLSTLTWDQLQLVLLKHRTLNPYLGLGAASFCRRNLITWPNSRSCRLLFSNCRGRHSMT